MVRYERYRMGNIRASCILYIQYQVNLQINVYTGMFCISTLIYICTITHRAVAYYSVCDKNKYEVISFPGR